MTTGDFAAGLAILEATDALVAATCILVVVTCQLAKSVEPQTARKMPHALRPGRAFGHKRYVKAKVYSSSCRKEDPTRTLLENGWGHGIPCRLVPRFDAFRLTTRRRADPDN